MGAGRDRARGARGDRRAADRRAARPAGPRLHPPHPQPGARHGELRRDPVAATARGPEPREPAGLAPAGAPRSVRPRRRLAAPSPVLGLAALRRARGRGHLLGLPHPSVEPARGTALTTGPGPRLGWPPSAPRPSRRSHRRPASRGGGTHRTARHHGGPRRAARLERRLVVPSPAARGAAQRGVHRNLDRGHGPRSRARSPERGARPAGERRAHGRAGGHHAHAGRTRARGSPRRSKAPGHLHRRGPAARPRERRAAPARLRRQRRSLPR